jgi:riboflavin transporter FmnP
MNPTQVAPVTGNLGLGILAGFFGGCIGLILVYALAKGAATKKGAGIGFAAQIIVGAVLRAAAR